MEVAARMTLEFCRIPKVSIQIKRGEARGFRTESRRPHGFLKRIAGTTRRVIAAVMPGRTIPATEASRPAYDPPMFTEGQITPDSISIPAAQEDFVEKLEPQPDVFEQKHVAAEKDELEAAENKSANAAGSENAANAPTITKEDIEKFSTALIAGERSKSTVEKYTLYVRRLAAWVGTRPLSKNLLVEWKRGLETEGMNPSTQNACIAAVNKYLSFLDRKDCLLKSVKIQRQDFCPENRNLTREDYEALIAEAKRQGKDRIRLIMDVLAGMGLRVSELKFITVEAVQKGRAEITMKGKSRILILPEELKTLLLEYVGQQGIVSGCVFLTRTGNPISRKQVIHDLKVLCDGANVERGKVFPHNFRHLFARTYYDMYHDLAALANLLGHSNVQTTRIYLRPTVEHCARQMDALNLIL